MHWTKRLNQKERAHLVSDIRKEIHRTKQLPNVGYNTARDLDYYKHLNQLDLVEMIMERSRNLKRPLRFFDSGAGLALTPIQLKQLFRDQIEVTAISLVHPNLSDKTREKAMKEYKNMHLVQPKSEIIKQWDQVRQGYKLIDKLKVGLLENFNIRKKQDIILDWFGPLSKSKHRERVIEKYYNSLNRGGIIITTRSSVDPAQLEGKFTIKYYPTKKDALHVILTRI